MYQVQPVQSAFRPVVRATRPLDPYCVEKYMAVDTKPHQVPPAPAAAQHSPANTTSVYGEYLCCLFQLLLLSADNDLSRGLLKHAKNATLSRCVFCKHLLVYRHPL
jgi:hypothetical protein